MRCLWTGSAGTDPNLFPNEIDLSSHHWQATKFVRFFSFSFSTGSRAGLRLRVCGGLGMFCKGHSGKRSLNHPNIGESHEIYQSPLLVCGGIDGARLGMPAFLIYQRDVLCAVHPA